MLWMPGIILHDSKSRSLGSLHLPEAIHGPRIFHAFKALNIARSEKILLALSLRTLVSRRQEVRRATDTESAELGLDQWR